MLNRAKDLWEKDKIEIMLTRSTTNLKSIKEAGIPFIHIIPTEKIISNAIEDALTEIKKISPHF